MYSKCIFSKAQNGYLWQCWSTHRAKDNGPARCPALQYEEALHNGYIWHLLLTAFHSASLEGFSLHHQAEMTSSYDQNRCKVHTHTHTQAPDSNQCTLRCKIQKAGTVLLLRQPTDIAVHSPFENATKLNFLHSAKPKLVNAADTEKLRKILQLHTSVCKLHLWLPGIAAFIAISWHALYHLWQSI
jgi:hypothetical protein